MSERVSVIHGDSRESIKAMADCSIDSCVTDPPYALVSIVKRFGKAGAAPAKGNAAYTRASSGFMGQQWDTGETAFDPDFWREVFRVLKPGAHLVAFSGTRTYHRMACAIEDAGFEIRDQIAWLYGSGFPKSHDVSKAIDKAAGAEREVVRRHIQSINERKSGFAGEDHAFGAWQYDVTAPATDAAREWEGWGTALKPACEPICLARKPLSEKTIAANVLRWGVGTINVDGCRVATDETITATRNYLGGAIEPMGMEKSGERKFTVYEQNAKGRWPANIVHDGSDEVAALFPDSDSGSGSGSGSGGIWTPSTGKPAGPTYGDGSGSAARFFYQAKADSDDRLGFKHPTVKPVDLMQWLVRLVTPKNGLVLDPFAGTGTTGEAAFREGMRAVLIEREERFVDDIRKRIALFLAGPDERKRHSIKTKIADGRLKDDAGPLFGGAPETMRGGAERSTVTSQIRTPDRPDGTQTMSEKAS